MADTIAEHIAARLKALGDLSYREAARRVMAEENRDPSVDGDRFDDWRDRISDYVNSSGKEPNDATIKLLAKALGDEPADWPGRRKRPTTLEISAHLEEVAERAAFLLSEYERLSKDLKDARTRLGRLERARKQDLAAATQSGGS